ncbi:hypothetical protein QBC37DRAFT_455407 [Rhypophila decipiens]|uniref:Uncharacterized protein n=1 Tax=Rhypophila decipiens TaxID=261697 RepID=A0AAN6XZS1_9PEZI|nr:hypothetical protein QBC37DRAFT_455407 [Rhypophila decipiens]
MSARSKIIEALKDEAAENKYASTFKKRWYGYNNNQKMIYLARVILPKREALWGNEKRNRELKTIMPLVSAQMWDAAQKALDGRRQRGELTWPYLLQNGLGMGPNPVIDAASIPQYKSKHRGTNALPAPMALATAPGNPGIPSDYNPSAGYLPANTFTLAEDNLQALAPTERPQPQQLSEEDRPMLENLVKEREESVRRLELQIQQLQDQREASLRQQQPPQQQPQQQMNGLVADEPFDWLPSLEQLPSQTASNEGFDKWPQPVENQQLAPSLTGPQPSPSPEDEDLYWGFNPLLDQALAEYQNQQTDLLPPPPPPLEEKPRPEPIMMEDTESCRRAAKYYRMHADDSKMCWSDNKAHLESLFDNMFRCSSISSETVEFLDRQFELYEQYLRDVGKIRPQWMSDEELMKYAMYYQARDYQMRGASVSVIPSL